MKWIALKKWKKTTENQQTKEKPENLKSENSQTCRNYNKILKQKSNQQCNKRKETETERKKGNERRKEESREERRKERKGVKQ